MSLSLSNWYPWSGVVLDCIDSRSLHPYLLMFMTCFNASKTLTETALKDIPHQIIRSRGDITTIWHVKLIDKDTKTEHGLPLTIVVQGLPKLRPGIHLSVIGPHLSSS